MSCEDKKSICFLTDMLIIGGIENVLVEAIKVLHDKYDIKIVSLYHKPQKEILEKLPSDVTVIERNMPPKKPIHRLPYFAGLYFNKVFKSEKFDYIIGLKRGEMYACFSNHAKHHIYWCHNDYDVKYLNKDVKLNLKQKLYKYSLKLVYKNNDFVWTVNSTIADSLAKVFSLDNFRALPNPIDCESIIKKSEMACDVVFDEKKINLLLLGRISREKGYDRVIKILADGVFDKYPNLHLYIVGDGATKNLIKLIETLNVGDRVTLLGAKSNPYPYLKQASVLISPSNYESFGLVMLEAMLLNVPVIATNSSGGRYVTQNGELARLVENNDIALKEAIVQFVEEPEAYGYSLKKAQEWAYRHDLKFFGERIINLLEECEKKK